MAGFFSRYFNYFKKSFLSVKIDILHRFCHFAHKYCTKAKVFIYLKYQKRNTRISFQKGAKKVKKVVDICHLFCYYIRALRTEAKHRKPETHN